MLIYLGILYPTRYVGLHISCPGNIILNKLTKHIGVSRGVVRGGELKRLSSCKNPCQVPTNEEGK